MTMPQVFLPPSATNLGLQQLDPNSALAQAQFAQAAALASMQQSLGSPNAPSSAGMPPMAQPPSGGSVLTPDVLKRYIPKEGIGSPAQAAEIALLAWKNGDIAVAQFAAKIATNYSIAKLIAGQDGDANSISWTDLGKLAKGKSAIGRDDIGAAPDLTEALESDLRAMVGLGAGASTQNQWDPYGTTAASMGGQPLMQGGQPASLNGVNGNVYMMPYAQAQQLASLTPLQQSMQLAGVGSNLSPLMQQAGLASPGTFQQQQQTVAAIPAAISQPISSGTMLQQQPPVGYPQQQPMASMPIPLQGTYRVALIPTF